MYERGGAQDDGWILWIVTDSRDLTGYVLIGNMHSALAPFPTCLQLAASPTAEPSNSGGQHADFEVSVRSYLPNLAQSILRFLSCV